MVKNARRNVNAQRALNINMLRTTNDMKAVNAYLREWRTAKAVTNADLRRRFDVLRWSSREEAKTKAPVIARLLRAGAGTQHPTVSPQSLEHIVMMYIQFGARELLDLVKALLSRGVRPADFLTGNYHFAQTTAKAGNDVWLNWMKVLRVLAAASKTSNDADRFKALVTLHLYIFWDTGGTPKPSRVRALVSLGGSLTHQMMAYTPLWLYVENIISKTRYSPQRNKSNGGFDPVMLRMFKAAGARIKRQGLTASEAQRRALDAYDLLR